MLQQMIGNSALDSKRVAVYGMPGAGKTQLALQYATNYRKANPQSNIFHVDASEPETLWKEFQKINCLLSLTTDSEAMVDIVRQWLINSPDWILLMDNVFQVETVKPFLPAGDSGMVIFTMRDEFAAKALGTSGTLALGPMDEDEAVEVLLRSAQSAVTPENRAQALELARELGSLPLALGQSASYIMRRKDWTFPRYLETLKKQKMETLKADPKGIAQLTVYDTFTIAADQLDPKARSLLKLLAHLDYHDVSMELLAHLVRHDIPKDPLEGVPIHHQSAGIREQGSIFIRQMFRRPKEPKEQRGPIHPPGESLSTTFPSIETIENAVLDLHSAGLIGRSDEGNIWVHDLVAEISRNEGGEFAEMAIELCNSSFPDDVKSPAEWSACHETSTHVVASLRHAQDHGIHSESLFRCQNRLALYFREQGKYEEAKKGFERTLDGQEKVLAKDHPDVLWTVRSIGSVLDIQGQYDEAQKWFMRALQGQQEVLGNDHLDTLRTVNNMGNVLDHQGRREEALERYMRALAGREKALGGNHPDTLWTVENIGSVFYNQGRNEEALEWFKRALAGQTEALGKDHPDTLRVVENIGNILQRQERYKEALEMYSGALAGLEKVLVEDHPEILRTVNNIGNVLKCQKRYEEALERYMRALAGQEEALGKDHPETLRTVDNIGSLLNDQERYEEAVQWYTRALAGREKVLGGEHPDTVWTRDNLNTCRRMVHVRTTMN
jgi:tetratricopeptide (TPR) repeat protein